MVIYRKICPGEDVGRRAPVDGLSVDDEGYGIEEKADGCNGDGSSAQNTRALFDCHPWRLSTHFSGSDNIAAQALQACEKRGFMDGSVYLIIDV